MSSDPEEFTIGVEEEYQIVDPRTRELRSRADRILQEARTVIGDRVQPELHLSMIEIGTPVCHTLADVRAEIVRLRGEVIAAAEKKGYRIAAAGTHPVVLRKLFQTQEGPHPLVPYAAIRNRLSTRLRLSHRITSI